MSDGERVIAVSWWWALLLLLGSFACMTGSAWLMARSEPSQREQIMRGRLAVADSQRVLDSLRIEYLEAESLLWRERTEEACRMLPLSDFESCRLTIDTRLQRKRQVRR